MLFARFHLVTYWFHFVFSKLSWDVLYDEEMFHWLGFPWAGYKGSCHGKNNCYIVGDWLQILGETVWFLTFKVFKSHSSELFFHLWFTSFSECSSWSCVDLLSLSLHCNFMEEAMWQSDRKVVLPFFTVLLPLYFFLCTTECNAMNTFMRRTCASSSAFVWFIVLTLQRHKRKGCAHSEQIVTPFLLCFWSLPTPKGNIWFLSC